MIRLGVAGAKGRTGRCVVELALRDPRFEVVAAIDLDPKQPLPACAVLIDFTNASGTMQWLEECHAGRIPLVVGATGHDEQQLARISQVAHVIPIIKSANFSVGVQVVLGVLGKIADALGEEYDIEIVETHHRHKIDAPSGTAIAMVDQIKQSRDRKGADNVVFGRHGNIGQRPRGQIGVHAVRMGEVVGQHEIHFSGPGETITIRHTAQSRETFAAGALRAASWIIGKPPGLYSMRNVLGKD